MPPLSSCLARRHGLAPDGAEADGGSADTLALAEPALAAIAGASVVGRVATGPWAVTLMSALTAVILALPSVRVMDTW